VTASTPLKATLGHGATDAPDADVETRERILAAAHRVFLRSGTAKARTQEIANEAGVNKALLHYYFGTKAALADAVFRHHLMSFMPRIFGLLGDPELDIAEKVRAIVREQISFHRERPYLAGFLASEFHAEPDRMTAMMAPVGAPPLQVLAKQLSEAADAGTIRRISVEQFVVTLIGAIVLPFVLRPMVANLFGLQGDRFDAFLDERTTVLPEFILAGLRP
jgi:AcrR family transcriptional regulator